MDEYNVGDEFNPTKIESFCGSTHTSPQSGVTYSCSRENKHTGTHLAAELRYDDHGRRSWPIQATWS